MRGVYGNNGLALIATQNAITRLLIALGHNHPYRSTVVCPDSAWQPKRRVASPCTGNYRASSGKEGSERSKSPCCRRSANSYMRVGITTGVMSSKKYRQCSFKTTNEYFTDDPPPSENHVKCSSVISVLCGCVAVMLLMLSVAATTWLEADGTREGLWERCKWRDRIGLQVDCESSYPRGKGWVHACRTLCLLSLGTCLVSIVVACVGLRTDNYRSKYTYYKVSLGIMFLAALLEIISLIIFPVKFLEEIHERPHHKWEFGWAYGIGWGAAIFMFGSAILLLIDRESEEVIYREKTIYNKEPEPEEV